MSPTDLAGLDAENRNGEVPGRPVWSLQRLLGFVLSGLILLIDGYDLSAMPIAVPHIAASLGIMPAGFGIAMSAVLIGLGLGVVFLAPFGDRMGRRRTIVATVALIGLATVGTATAHSIATFGVWRLATGLALGACLPNVTAQVALWASDGQRARTVTLVSLGIPIGGTAAGLVAPSLSHWGGWQSIFIVPGLSTIGLALLLALLLPPIEPAKSQATGSGRDAHFLAVVRPPLWLGLVVFTLLYTLNAFLIYLVTSWIPTLLPLAGFGVDLAARYLSLIQFGGLLLGLALAQLLDKEHAPIAFSLGYAVVSIGFLLLWFVPPEPLVWGALLVISGGGVAGLHVAIIAVATKFFPSRNLAGAIGLGVAVARLGAIAGPVVGGRLIAAHISPGAFFLAALVPAGACLLVTLMIPAAQRGAATIMKG